MMTDTLPGRRRFLDEVWRKRPLLIRAALPGQLRSSLTFDRFRRWCTASNFARIYVRTEAEAQGSAKARILYHPPDGLAIYDHFSARREPITLLLNGTETIEPLLSKIQSRFGIPFEWRRGDIVATLSAPGAGIGYHGGSEDGFIVQLQGERDWSIWSPDALSLPYREFLCGSPVEPPPERRTEATPLLSVTLKPGDALYVPALFPHEGITVAESLSLSLAWRGLSAFRTFLDLHQARHSSKSPMLGPQEAAWLYQLLDDPSIDADAELFLCEALIRIFEALPAKLRPNEEQVKVYVSLLLG